MYMCGELCAAVGVSAATPILCKFWDNLCFFELTCLCAVYIYPEMLYVLNIHIYGCDIIGVYV